MEQVLTEKFNSISVKKGEKFVIALKGNGTTGYLWDLSVTAGKAALITRDFSAAITASRQPACGAGGTYIWTYKAKEDGVIEINAEYKRSWENKPAEKNVKFTIKVG